eukprot:symbB.v1.2.005662.t1/scaffold327.1/size259883/15
MVEEHLKLQEGEPLSIVLRAGNSRQPKPHHSNVGASPGDITETGVSVNDTGLNQEVSEKKPSTSTSGVGESESHAELINTKEEVQEETEIEETPKEDQDGQQQHHDHHDAGKQDEHEQDSSFQLPDSFQVSPNRDRKVVRTMAESFMFENDCLETLWDEDGEDKIHSIIDALQTDTMSTAFSGIEAAGTSMQLLRKSLADLTGVDIPRQHFLYQVEWNQECQQELLGLAVEHDACLFPNIASFYRDELQSTVDACLKSPAMAVEVLGPLISAKKAMKLDAPCLTHGKNCTMKPSRRHVAGTSCKPWSVKGSGLAAADPEIVFTMAWLGLRIMLEDDEILSENVKSPSSTSSSDPSGVVDAGLGNLLLRFLAPLYHMETTLLDPSMIGDPFSRQREFVKMRHKAKCLCELSPMSRFNKRFFRVCQWSWKSHSAAHCTN